ncbi:putative transcriptional regulator with an HTH domain [Thermoplasmatales archaeon BRNA1]|nr:putative transcriptional regulator with an HTH domain [Thermoplasmatales archaeon BRNA1]
MTVDDLISSMLREEGGFQKSFRSILDDELHMSLNEFCQVSGISQSTMYKILEERREPNLRTIRQIIKAINIISSRDTEKFVAVIASTSFMVGLPRSLDTLANGEVSVREYTVSSVEDAILAAVRAERDGALAIICAPIVAETIEKITKVQVFPVVPMDSVVKILDDIKTRY